MDRHCLEGLNNLARYPIVGEALVLCPINISKKSNSVFKINSIFEN